VPVINAGDGESGQHPTQALLDLSTIEASELFSHVGNDDRGRNQKEIQRVPM
jgi:aspartate carbamoyltransferase catalytic subunit